MGKKIFASIIIVGLSVLFISEQIEADKHDVEEYRIYDNIWRGKFLGKEATVEMAIYIPGAGDISWKINGKELDHAEYEYVYSRFPDLAPFLCVYAREDDKEHIFYGVSSIHQEPPSYFQIRGVYEMRYPCSFGEEPETCVQLFDIDLHGPPLDEGK